LPSWRRARSAVGLLRFPGGGDFSSLLSLLSRDSRARSCFRLSPHPIRAGMVEVPKPLIFAPNRITANAQPDLKYDRP
jgi:hypothetical protein